MTDIVGVPRGLDFSSEGSGYTSQQNSHTFTLWPPLALLAALQWRTPDKGVKPSSSCPSENWAASLGLKSHSRTFFFWKQILIWGEPLASGELL